MLSEQISQLISAYVDGELSARERRSLERLLRKSPEARQLLQQLKKDSLILRKLPRRKTQLDLSGTVMGTISLRNIQLPKIESAPPGDFPGLPPRRRPWPWQAVTAAFVLLTIGTASYLIFSATFNPATVEQTRPGTAGPVEPDASEQGRSAEDRPPLAVTVIHEPELSPTLPEREARKDPRYGSWHLPLPPFAAPQPRLMAILPLRALDQPPGTAQLLQELKKDHASRLDLYCLTDTRKALDRLQALLKTKNVVLRPDSFAQARLKQPAETNFALYTEDLTPEDLKALIQQLAVEDRKAILPAFDKLAVNPLTPAELASVLGGEASFYQPPAQHGPLGVDPSKDIASGTGAQVSQGLTGQGGSSAQAVVVPYGLPQPGFSQEVKNLVEYRKGWKPGAIQVLLVLWNSPH